MRDGVGHRSRLPRVPSVFCPTHAAQGVVRHLAPLVVLRAPRGFGKTSTVAYWLRSGTLDDRAAVWLTLPEPTTSDELWLAVHDSLVAAGLGAPEATPDRGSVERALRHLTRRLVLVLDGLHNVADTSLDGALVELVQAHELLHLIVMTRVERPIVSIGPATVDTAVLEVPELLLGVAEAGLLASLLGLSAAEEEIARLAAEYGGWPALVRTALLDTRRGPDGGLVTDRGGVTRYAGLILADPENAQWRDVVMSLAVPHRLRPEDLTELFDGSEQRSAAQAVLTDSFIIDRSGGAPDFPAGLRHAALENLRAQDPHRYREINERLSKRRRLHHEPVEALVHALRAQAWPLVLTLLEENWAQLLRRHRDHVYAAVRAMPPELVASSPRLIVARDYVLDQDTATLAESALREGLLTPGSTLPVQSLTTTQRLALRFDGTPTYGAAEILLGHLDSEASWGQVPRAPEVERAVPELLTEWGLSLLYDNDGVGAAYGFALACQEAERLGDHAAAREAASGTALAMALLGHTGVADAWSAHAVRFAAAPSGLEVVAAPLTRAVLAGLRLAEASFPDGAPHAGVEHGIVPLLELSRVAAAFSDVLVGRLDRARVELQRHAVDHDQEEVIRASVTALQVDLALAEGRIDRAGALLVAAERGGAWTLATRARHAFYVGAHAEALRLTENAAAYAGARPRVGLELLLIHACAAWRSGHGETAVDQLATAVGIAADTEVLSPFLTVPRADLEAIAPPGTWARELLDRAPLAGTDTVFPEPLSVGQLSAAELRVLRELQRGGPLSTIGRRLYLSESTVKTHVRRIYRKLGVSSRGEAIDRARELLQLP